MAMSNSPQIEEPVPEPQITQNPEQRARWYEKTKKEYVKRIEEIIKQAVRFVSTRAKVEIDCETYFRTKEEIYVLQNEFNKKVEQAGNYDLFDEGAQKLIKAYKKENQILPPLDLRVYPVLQLGDKRGLGIYNYKDFEIKVVVTNLSPQRMTIDIDPDKEFPGGDRALYRWRFEVEPVDQKNKVEKIFYDIEYMPSDKDNLVSLDPGKKLERQLGLGKQYNITSPGKYKVRLVYAHMDGGTFASNWIEIELFRNLAFHK